MSIQHRIHPITTSELFLVVAARTRLLVSRAFQIRSSDLFERMEES
jgi:hypothetical protein